MLGRSAADLADIRWRLRTIAGSNAESQLRSDIVKVGLAEHCAGVERFVAVLVGRMTPRNKRSLQFSDSVLDALAQSLGRMQHSLLTRWA